jgi:hypothetical protein
MATRIRSDPARIAQRRCRHAAASSWRANSNVGPYLPHGPVGFLASINIQRQLAVPTLDLAKRRSLTLERGATSPSPANPTPRGSYCLEPFSIAHFVKHITRDSIPPVISGHVPDYPVHRERLIHPAR